MYIYNIQEKTCTNCMVLLICFFFFCILMFSFQHQYGKRQEWKVPLHALSLWCNIHKWLNTLLYNFQNSFNIFVLLIIHAFIHLSIYPFFLDELISLPLLVVWVTLTTQEDLLTGSSCPSGLIGPQHPVRRDQYIIPSVTSPARSPPLPSLHHFASILLLFLTADRYTQTGPL